jgi:hypothetical protein
VFSTGEDVFKPILDFVGSNSFESVEFKKGVYWTVLNSLLSCLLVWFVFCWLVYLKYREVNLKWFNWLADLAEATMPIACNVLFLPVISVLFDVFICEEAHGVDESDLEYEDSFMYRDCNEDCWVGSHKKYAIAAAIALCCYFPVTFVTRPLWQVIQNDLHVFTRPTFYLQKSFVEVTLVVLRRTLRKDNPLVHSFLFISIILVHALYSLRRHPFNYARLNLWFTLSMLVVMIISVLSVMEQNVEVFNVTIAVAMIIGFGVLIVLAGIIVQCMFFPRLLISPKGPDLQVLFKFAFDLRNVKPPAELTFPRATLASFEQSASAQVDITSNVVTTIVGEAPDN